MLGVIATVPSGLIVTNDEYRERESRKSVYVRNALSEVRHKHVADLDGFIDVDVLRVSEGSWRERGDPLRQAFAFVDLRRANEEERAIWMSMQQMEAEKEMESKLADVDAMKRLMESVQREVEGIKEYNKEKEKEMESKVADVDAMKRLMES